MNTAVILAVFFVEEQEITVVKRGEQRRESND